MKDQQIIDGLRQGGRKERKALEAIYNQYFAAIRKLVCSNQGTEEEAHDIFQDAVIVLYKNVKTNRFEGKSKLSTYLYGIAQKQWLLELRKRNRKVFLEQHEQDETTPLLLLLDQEVKDQITQAIGQLTNECQRLLKLSIYEEQSMKEIAQQMGHSSDQVTRNQKSRCMKYLSRLLLNSSLFSLLSNPSS